MKLGINTYISCGGDLSDKMTACGVVELTEDEFLNIYGHFLRYTETQKILNAKPDEKNPVVVKKSGQISLWFYVL